MAERPTAATSKLQTKRNLSRDTYVWVTQLLVSRTDGYLTVSDSLETPYATDRYYNGCEIAKNIVLIMSIGNLHTLPLWRCLPS